MEEYFPAPAAPQPKRNNAPAVVLGALAAVLAVLLVLTLLLFSDPCAGRGLENVQPSDALASDFLKSAAAQQECSFTPDDLNPFLAYVFRKSGAGSERHGVTLLCAAVADASGDSADVYLPAAWKGKRFGVLANVTPSLDSAGNRLLFRVNSVRVGRLPVPVGFALDRAEDLLPEGFERSGSTISCAAPSLDASAFFVSASVRVSKFSMEDGALKIAASAEISIG